MAKRRQRTGFGPGSYRGKPFTVDKLRQYAEGTNKAIQAGIPIPLLKKHAPIGADDEGTIAAANLDGFGWLEGVEQEEDGSLAWLLNVTDEAANEAIDAGTLKFTSPEFRESYVSEKAGVYEGPIIRHVAFTPLPGNPHQGNIETIALSEAEGLFPGCFQFAEGDKEPLEEQHAEASGRILKSKHHEALISNGYAYTGSGDKGWEHYYKHPAGGLAVVHFKAGNDAHGILTEHTKIADEQHAEMLSGYGKPANDEPPPPAAPPDKEVNPDMPPKATDKTKCAAVLAGLNKKGVVLPSDFDFTDEAALDILLAALNSSIKAEQEAEAKNKEPEEESPPPKEAAMPFSEQELASIPEPLRARFTQEQEARKAAEYKAAEAEAKATQFAEREATAKNESAKAEAIRKIEDAPIPPALRKTLLATYDAVQFSEGNEQPTYTAVQVAELVGKSIPTSLQFLEELTIKGRLKQASNPKDGNGKAVAQFFEADGDIPSGHISAERAEELVASSPIIGKKYTPGNSAPKTLSGLVKEDATKHPLGWDNHLPPA